MFHLAFAKPFESAYIRTKQKNIRCFPNCSDGVHKPKSFCGDSLFVKLFGDVTKSRNIFVFGEFRAISQPRTRSLGEHCIKEEMKEDLEYFLATMVSIGMSETQFVFNPPRKWKYQERYVDEKFHIFTIYCVADNIVQSVLDSSPFEIISIRKLEGAGKKDLASLRRTMSSSSASSGNSSSLPRVSSLSETKPFDPSLGMRRLHELPISSSSTPSPVGFGLPDPSSQQEQFHNFLSHQPVLLRPMSLPEMMTSFPSIPNHHSQHFPSPKSNNFFPKFSVPLFTQYKPSSSSSSSLTAPLPASPQGLNISGLSFSPISNQLRRGSSRQFNQTDASDEEKKKAKNDLPPS